MFFPMLGKVPSAIKPFLTVFTFEGFRSGVGVHVDLSMMFVSEHLGTEIAFEFGR